MSLLLSYFPTGNQKIFFSVNFYLPRIQRLPPGQSHNFISSQISFYPVRWLCIRIKNINFFIPPVQYAKRSSQSCHNFCTLTNWHIKRVKKVVSVPDISGGIIKLIRTDFSMQHCIPMLFPRIQTLIIIYKKIPSFSVMTHTSPKCLQIPRIIHNRAGEFRLHSTQSGTKIMEEHAQKLYLPAAFTYLPIFADRCLKIIIICRQFVP